MHRNQWTHLRRWALSNAIQSVLDVSTTTIIIHDMSWLALDKYVFCLLLPELVFEEVHGVKMTSSCAKMTSCLILEALIFRLYFDELYLRLVW